MAAGLVVRVAGTLSPGEAAAEGSGVGDVSVQDGPPAEGKNGFKQAGSLPEAGHRLLLLQNSPLGSAPAWPPTQLSEPRAQATPQMAGSGPRSQEGPFHPQKKKKKTRSLRTSTTWQSSALFGSDVWPFSSTAGWMQHVAAARKCRAASFPQFRHPTLLRGVRSRAPHCLTLLRAGPGSP